MKISINAYAKINLYLAVTGRRDNGYHDIESVMQSVSLHDTVTLSAEPSEQNEILLSCSDASLPTDEKNLAYRAASLYLSVTGTENVRVRIYIDKRIPVAAGLAGGSADAAGTLIALNALSFAPMPTKMLCELGARLGADIPFVIRGGTMTALGIGEILSPCAQMPDCPILIVRPREAVSTGAAYAKIDERSLFSAPKALCEMTDALASASLDKVADAAYNVFEAVIPEESEVFRLKTVLTENGATLSMMSGSGPSVFGVFRDEKTALAAARAVQALGYETELCRPIPASADECTSDCLSCSANCPHSGK